MFSQVIAYLKSYGFNGVHTEGRTLVCHLFTQLPYEYSGQNRSKVFHMQKRFTKVHFLLKAVLTLNTLNVCRTWHILSMNFKRCLILPS